MIYKFLTPIRYAQKIIIIFFYFFIAGVAYAEEFSKHSYKLPFVVDKNNAVPSFITLDKWNGYISELNEIWIQPEKLRFMSKEQVANDIEQYHLKRIPRFTTAISHKALKINFSSILAYDGDSFYAHEETVFLAENYFPVLLKNIPGDSFLLEREKQAFTLVFHSSNDIMSLSFLGQEMVFDVLTNSDVQDKVVALPLQDTIYRFEYWKGMEFTLRSIAQQFHLITIPFDSWEVKEDGTYHCAIEFSLRPFDMEIVLTGEASTQFQSLELVAEKEPGNPRFAHGDSTQEQHKFFRFSGLDWPQSPFTVSGSVVAAHMEPIQIKLASHFDKLDYNGEKPFLRIKQQVLLYTGNVVIQVTDSQSNVIPDLVVTLFSFNNPRQKKEERLTDEYGEVSFTDVYDWRNREIIIQQNNKEDIIAKTNLGKLQVIGSGKSRLELQFSLARTAIGKER